MDIGKTLRLKSREDWRRWLAKNHDKEKEIWLIYYKKSSGKQTITVDEAIGEALCYGWIDSQIKPIDEEKYASRFTPRGSSSKWSKRNIAIGLKLLEDGKMTRAGVTRLPPQVLRRLKKRET